MSDEHEGMKSLAIQDVCVAGKITTCFCCGRDNPLGLRIKTYWDGHEGVCRFKPQAHHTGPPGLLYGGLIASLFDCHSMATAMAAAYEAENREPNTEPAILFLTANLNVDYLRPTPMEAEVILRAKVEELTGRKVVVGCRLFADGLECVRGRVIGVRAAD